MARLARFRQDTDRIAEGDWIEVGEEGDRFRIRTRGQTKGFLVRLNELRREAARELNRSLKPGQMAYAVADLPPHIENRCLGAAMADETFIDVGDLDDADGPVTAEQFRGYLRDPMKYMVLISLAYGAVIKVHADREADVQDAMGNSSPASAGS